jgi:hypothetical protein
MTVKTTIDVRRLQDQCCCSCESGQIGLQRPPRSCGKTDSFGYGGRRLGPALLFSAIRRNPMRQEKLTLTQTKKCCRDLDHQAHRRADIAKT